MTEITRRPLRTVLRLALACLVVGMVLAALGVTPDSLLAEIADAARWAFDGARDVGGWAAPYLLLGALVVLPVWLLRRLWRRLLGRR